MSERVLNLQNWLNVHGATLTIDGSWGPATRSAVIEVFRNKDAPAATPGELSMIASRLGCTARQLAAVAKVEGGGSGWDDSGLLKCLWERHWMWRRVKMAAPLLSDPKPGGYTIDADGDGINDSWEKLADATGRWGFSLAAECASFGKFQVMGGHWKALGYRSVADFVWQLSQGEAAHYDLFARYIEVNGMKRAAMMVGGDPEMNRAFAAGYNGAGYRKFDYHVKIADAYRRLA